MRVIRAKRQIAKRDRVQLGTLKVGALCIDELERTLLVLGVAGEREAGFSLKDGEALMCLDLERNVVGFYASYIMARECVGAVEVALDECSAPCNRCGGIGWRPVFLEPGRKSDLRDPCDTCDERGFLIFCVPPEAAQIPDGEDEPEPEPEPEPAPEVKTERKKAKPARKLKRRVTR